jgi:large subunit ribosomal protein L9
VQVILLSDVEKVGLRGEVVDVARGYARNFLLPRRLAEQATPGRVAELRKREEQRGRQEARSAEQATEIAEVLGKTVLRFEVKAGPTGSLFGSVTPTDIADEIWRTRKVRIDRRKIGLDDPIKRIGRYVVPIGVFEGVGVEVKTLVVPEGGELPPEEELEAMVAAEEAEAQEDGDREGAEVDPLEAAVEELEAAEAESVGDDESPLPPQAQAEQVPDDAFDRAVDEAVGVDPREEPS